MTAELLREAANDLRAKASAAALTGAWEWGAENGLSWFTSTRLGLFQQAMSPTFALAVADWLDQAAIHLAGGSLSHHPMSARALIVARAYLGREA